MSGSLADVPPPGIGCMRLSTEPDRDEARGVAVLHAAFDAGLTFLDTANAYCRDDDDVGHNERLIAAALETWNGDRSRIVVATKGGLTRPRGAWIPDGRARHLIAACDASRHALRVERIPLYQLHAPDPRTPLATSVRALDQLKRGGAIDAIGLCNVTVGQIEEALQITTIAAVQVELSPWRRDNVFNGVAAFCVANGIRLLAHRPLGGRQGLRRAASDPLLRELAALHDTTSHQIALAWLMSLSPHVLPLPGATRVETARSIARSRRIALTAEDRARLDERFPAERMIRGSVPPSPAPARTDGEIVVVMGLPGAGKSTHAATLVERGYQRLNRDEAGGTLQDLLPELDRALESGAARLVLDNTYASRASRATVVETARAHGLPVRCVWIASTLEESQVNAVSRIVSRYGRLLGPEELRVARKRDVAAFGPSVLFRYQRELEPPVPEEGFSTIDVVPFERRADPTHTERALIVWCDGVLARSRSGKRAPASPDDLEVPPERAELLRGYAGAGWRILGLSWQPEIAAKTQTIDVVDATFARMRTLAGVDIEVAYCPHGAGPPTCWCRKPLPGLGVAFIHRHRLDPARCVYVGVGPQDPGFARRLGCQYRDAEDFFERGV
jgi:aryl-alcohol dehydrogenase-like predicted oxidoreductase/histidinol phosphatase-like enzyme/predicted kinase